MATWYKDSGPWWTNRNARTGDGISLEEEKTDKKSLWNFYKTLISIRKQNPVIIGGDFAFIPNDNPGVVSFVRTLNDEKILVVINLTGIPQKVMIRDHAQLGKARTILSEPLGSLIVQEGISIKPFGIFVTNL